jgi:hypothetical protein
VFEKHPMVWGFVFGVVGVWALHHFIHPLPGAAKSPVIS